MLLRDQQCGWEWLAHWRESPKSVGKYVLRAARRSCQLYILAPGLWFGCIFSLKDQCPRYLVSTVDVLRRWDLMEGCQVENSIHESISAFSVVWVSFG